jgi:hypothetical protein
MTKIERLQNIGIRRLGSPKRGFRYKPASGRVTSEDQKRIDELKIPPAWTDRRLGKMQRVVGSISTTQTTRALRSCASSSD